MTKKPSKSNKPKTLDFDKSLVLFRYFLSLFNSDDFKKFKLNFINEELENIDEEGRTGFIRKIILEKLYSDKLTIDKLYEYDENIVKHTKRINEKRSKKIKWKYFQYLTLLFTEIYLDKYFENREKLMNDLNEYLKSFIVENEIDDKYISKYSFEDLDKLAYWNATGSGKTLILHINILQYDFYVKKTNKYKVNKIILLTPNEGLSAQHLQEMKESGIPAKIFEDTGYHSMQREIEIIDIHKIRKDKTSSTGKTFDISAFGNNNLLLVDEGHRGSSGIEWKSIREQISEDGFVFEYSATFGQAINEGDNELREEYSKCILFDYSYKYFYHDYYGKDYKILNITDDSDEERKYLYLTASILSFYQQIKLYKSDKLYNKDFNIEKPLMLFVGGSVNSVRTDKGRKISDVLDILLFLNFFVKNDKKAENYIKNILSGNTGFLNSKGMDIFTHKFYFLNSTDNSEEKIYLDILKEVFNSNISGAEMHIENIKKADGEIGIKFGDNDYFGLINIGDVSDFMKLCELNGLHCSANEFDDTEFHKINKDNSTINMLIGSKKFTEGWSSWRVSSIGLMNIGKKQGSQIIQLFGRGVRLKGYGYSLKRSIGVQNLGRLRPANIEVLETLNIFGVKADYMAEFRKYLEDEGLPTETQVEILSLPVICTDKFKNEIKVLRVKDGLYYKKDAENPVLKIKDTIEKFKKSIQERPVVLDLYTKAESIESKNSSGVKIDKNNEVIGENSLNLLDFNRIFFEIEEYKNQKNLYNLNISKNSLKEILRDKDWYTLYCQEDEIKLEISNIRKIENIAVSLLKKYIDRYYNFQKSEWEKDKLEYVLIEEDKNSMKNMIDEYVFEIENKNIEIIDYLKKIAEEIKKNKKAIEFSKLKIEKKFTSGFEVFGRDNHLYNPLIFIGKNNTSIKVKPVNLNEGEKYFVETLKKYAEKNKEYFTDKELYLLRNQVGSLGFFEEGNFYPDFIMWIIDGDKQYINFIDPKGIREEGLNSSKIGLAKTIKKYQEQLKDENIVMNSFILSVTPYKELEFKTNWEIEEYYQNNVFFISDNMEEYEKIESIERIFNSMK